MRIADQITTIRADHQTPSHTPASAAITAQTTCRRNPQVRRPHSEYDTKALQTIATPQRLRWVTQQSRESNSATKPITDTEAQIELCQRSPQPRSSNQTLQSATSKPTMQIQTLPSPRNAANPYINTFKNLQRCSKATQA